MTPANLSYDRHAREMHHVELRIASLTRWGRPHPDSADYRLLAHFEAKRARLLADAAATMPAAPVKDTRRAIYGNDIRFPRGAWQPAGSIRINDCIGDIPACLRRVRT